MSAFNLPYINFVLNTVASVGYYIITFFLFYLVRQSQLINPLAFESIDVKKKLFFLINCVQILFGLFVGFCSLTHTMQALNYQYGEGVFIKYVETLILFTNAAIALITSFVAWKVFPLILETFAKLEILEKEKMQLVQVVNACQESVIAMSSSLLILQGNSATKLFFGENFVGSSILEYVWNTSDLKNIKSRLNNMLRSTSSAPFIIEYRAYKVNYDATNHDLSDREYVWLESSFLKTSNNVTHEVEFTMMTRNIDARKEAENVTKISNESREQSRINEEKLMYINCVAHDLKTPLQSFSFALDILKRSNLRPDQLEVAHEASVSIDLMKLTISQAMYIGKALSGVTVSARRTTVSISNILSHVKIIMNGCQPSIVIHYHVSESMCDSIITDEEWVWQMLLNLLTNACKYTDEGFIGVYVEEADNEEMLIFKVVDTGIGIAPNKLSTIFDAFNQAQQGQVVGTGLGLFGVRSRAEALGGSCGVWNNNNATAQCSSPSESHSGKSNGTNNVVTKGSTFWFKIPYVKDYSDAIARSLSKDDFDVEGGDSFGSINDLFEQRATNCRITNSISSEALTSRCYNALAMQSARSEMSDDFGEKNTIINIGSNDGITNNNTTGISRNIGTAVLSSSFFNNTDMISSSTTDVGCNIDFPDETDVQLNPILQRKSSAVELGSSSPLPPPPFQVKYDPIRNSRGGGGDHIQLVSNTSYNSNKNNNSYIVDVKPINCDTPKQLNSTIKSTNNINNAINNTNTNTSTFMMMRPNNNITPQDMIKSSSSTARMTSSNVSMTTINSSVNGNLNGGSIMANTSQKTKDLPMYDNMYSSENFSCSKHYSSSSSSPQSIVLKERLRKQQLISEEAVKEESFSSKPLLSKSEKTIASSVISTQSSSDNSHASSKSNATEKYLEAIVIDDTATIRKLLTRALLQLGFKRVDCYENGSRGLDAMKLRQVDIVFSDVQMPIMTGPEMATRFREFEEQELQSGARTHRQPIVAITANQAELISSTSAMSLFDQICIKPVDMNELSRTVQRFTFAPNNV